MKMTKGQLIRAMKDLDDDAQIRVFCTAMDRDGGAYAHDIYLEDEAAKEITIVAHF